VRSEAGQRSGAADALRAALDASCLTPHTSRKLILNADDFGLDLAINDAVEQAHVDGVLNSASLMVGGPALAQAVAIAKRLPTLGVGLHLVLADGPAVSPRRLIPDLVDATENFGDHMVRDGFRYFFLPHIRRQLAIEIRAQFEAFAATGLTLDHVNAHKHFHLHPTVLGLMLAIGRDYGLNAVRLPYEPGTAPLLAPWIALTRRRLRKAGIRHNDAMFGLGSTGATDEDVLLSAIERLPPGLNEIYLHPATRRGLKPTMADYRHDDELAALLSPRLREMIAARGIVTGRWSDFAANTR